MTQKAGIITWTIIVALLATIPFGEAQPELGPGISDAAAAGHTDGGGIRTDRLSHKNLRIWKKIYLTICTRDAKGQLLHPKLERLWSQVESSGHVVYIEMSRRTAESMAGKFTVERTDPEGRNDILSIRLFLSAIKKASTREGARRTDGFIPFERLDETERYAEVLGHELAHAVLTIKNPRYAALAREQSRLEAELVTQILTAGKVVVDVYNELRMRRLDQLALQVEAPANAVEIEIWRELAGKGRKNTKLRAHRRAGRSLAISVLTRRRL